MCGLTLTTHEHCFSTHCSPLESWRGRQFMLRSHRNGHGSYALVPGVHLCTIQSQPRYGFVRTVVLFICPFNPSKDKESRLSLRSSLLREPRAGGWTTGYMQEYLVKEPWHSLAFKHSSYSHPVNVKRLPVLFTL